MGPLQLIKVEEIALPVPQELMDPSPDYLFVNFVLQELPKHRLAKALVWHAAPALLLTVQDSISAVCARPAMFSQRRGKLLVLLAIEARYPPLLRTVLIVLLENTAIVMDWRCASRAWQVSTRM